jgi:hypothetical protein
MQGVRPETSYACTVLVTLSASAPNSTLTSLNGKPRETLADERHGFNGARERLHWLYRAKNRPAEMGYQVGLRFATFYKRAAVEREAIRRILALSELTGS